MVRRKSDVSVLLVVCSIILFYYISGEYALTYPELHMQEGHLQTDLRTFQDYQESKLNARM